MLTKPALGEAFVLVNTMGSHGQTVLHITAEDALPYLLLAKLPVVEEATAIPLVAL